MIAQDIGNGWEKHHHTKPNYKTTQRNFWQLVLDNLSGTQQTIILREFVKLSGFVASVDTRLAARLTKTCCKDGAELVAPWLHQVTKSGGGLELKIPREQVFGKMQILVQ